MRIPKHVGIIPDGNRRWAALKNMGKEKGYEFGLTSGVKALEFAKNAGIDEVTYYGFTVDNCKRPQVQVAAFSSACVKAAEILAGEGAELFVCGNTKSKCFPSELLPFARERVKVGKGGIKLNFLVNYGWEWDVGGFLKEGRANSRLISPVDLVIRWGGMRRLSGFLPIQSVYADFYVADSLWPDYKDEDFEKALLWYDKQDITRGG